MKPSRNRLGLVKDLHFKLPPGLIGNPIPLPECKIGAFVNETEALQLGYVYQNDCPPNTAVGVATVYANVPGFFGVLSLHRAVVQSGTARRGARQVRFLHS